MLPRAFVTFCPRYDQPSLDTLALSLDNNSVFPTACLTLWKLSGSTSAGGNCLPRLFAMLLVDEPLSLLPIPAFARPWLY